MRCVYLYSIYTHTHSVSFAKKQRLLCAKNIYILHKFSFRYCTISVQCACELDDNRSGEARVCEKKKSGFFCYSQDEES